MRQLLMPARDYATNAQIVTMNLASLLAAYACTGEGRLKSASVSVGQSSTVPAGRLPMGQFSLRSLGLATARKPNFRALAAFRRLSGPNDTENRSRFV